MTASDLMRMNHLVSEQDSRVYTPDVLRFFSTPSTILYPSLTTPVLSLFSFSRLDSSSFFRSSSLAIRALTYPAALASEGVVDPLEGLLWAEETEWIDAEEEAGRTG